MKPRALGLALMTSSFFACGVAEDPFEPAERDAGSGSVRDGGAVEADDGGHARDAGVLADGGAVDGGSDLDAGTTPRDAGSTPRDAGTTPRDGGTPMPTCDPSFGAGDACGGDPAGTWTYRLACTDQDFFAPLQQACPGLQVSNQLATTGGTVELRANGTFTRSVTTDVAAQSVWPAFCAQAAGGCAALQVYIDSLGDVTASCSSAAGGACACDLAAQIGTFDNGLYTVNGGIVVADGHEYYFCEQQGVLSYRGTANNQDDGTFTYVLTP